MKLSTMAQNGMLNDHRIEARDPTAPKRVYIFFHGHTGCGAGMLQCLANSLQDADPGAILHCPDGPVDLGWNARSWCQVDEADHHHPTPEIMGARLTATNAPRMAYIENIMRQEGVAPEQVIGGGHSLGASAMYYAALGMARPLAGVFSLSGGALDCLGEIHARPPVLIAAGVEEDFQDNSYYCGVPHTRFAEAFLRAHGVPVERRILPGREHNMCDDTGQLLAEFGKRVAPITQPFMLAGPAIQLSIGQEAPAYT